MVSWILILVLTAGSGVTVHHVPNISSKQACVEAAQSFKNQYRFSGGWAYCLPSTSKVDLPKEVEK